MLQDPAHVLEGFEAQTVFHYIGSVPFYNEYFGSLTSIRIFLSSGGDLTR